MTRTVDGDAVVRAMSDLRGLACEGRSGAGALRMVDSFAAQARGADCVFVARDGASLSVVAATAEAAGRLQRERITDVLDLSVDALTRGEPRVVEFHPADVPFDPHIGRAINAGFTHEYIFPLDFADRAIGTLILMDSADQPMSRVDLTVIRCMSMVASVALAHSEDVHLGKLRQQQLETALRSRIVIEQAKGIIAARSTCDMPTAFRTLRDQARRARQPIDAVALATVDGIRPQEKS